MVWWFLDSAGFDLAFNTEARPLPGAALLPWPFLVCPLLGGVVVPWTTLAYLIVFRAGVVGLDWLWLGLGFLIDLSSHFGGGYRHRDRIRGHRR